MFINLSTMKFAIALFGSASLVGLVAAGEVLKYGDECIVYKKDATTGAYKMAVADCDGASEFIWDGMLLLGLHLIELVMFAVYAK